jgi:Tfp pilus assembly protein PilN
MSVLTEKAAPPAVRPAPFTGRAETLNLARRPFTNSRPVARAAAVLWLLGALLLVGNVSLFWSYLSGSGAKRAELARMERQVDREKRELSQLEARLASTDLERQNKEVRFLNRRIAERTFSWSMLFDRLADVLPNDVRITRLTPQGPAADKETPDRQPWDNRVSLSLSGVSRTDEALLRFIDNLFAHPAFVAPNLSHETRDDDDLVKFEVQAGYLPDEPPVRVAVDGKTKAVAAPAPPPQAPGSEIE